MAGKKIVWNLTRLENLAGTLQGQVERLEEQRQYLITIKENVASNWESPAGVAYQEHMQADLDDMGRLIDALNEDIAALNSAKTDCYHACEDAVQRRLSQLGIA